MLCTWVIVEVTGRVDGAWTKAEDRGAVVGSGVVDDGSSHVKGSGLGSYVLGSSDGSADHGSSDSEGYAVAEGASVVGDEVDGLDEVGDDVPGSV